MYRQKKHFGPTKPVLYQKITAEEALNLKLTKQVSISVILLIPSLSGKIPEIIIIDEWKNFDQSRKKKFPGGKMEEIDKDVFTAAKREMEEETGLIMDEAVICFAGEFSSTIPGERHYKVFFLVKKYHSGKGPFKKDPGILSKEPLKGIEKVVNLGNQYCLCSCIEELKTWSSDYALPLLNYHVRDFHEGE